MNLNLSDFLLCKDVEFLFELALTLCTSGNSSGVASSEIFSPGTASDATCKSISVVNKNNICFDYVKKETVCDKVQSNLSSISCFCVSSITSS